MGTSSRPGLLGLEIRKTLRFLLVVWSRPQDAGMQEVAREIRDMKGAEKDELDQRKSGAKPVRAVELGRVEGVRKECASCKR